MKSSGLEPKSLTTASGETIPYAELAPASGLPAKRTVIMVHGITQDMTAFVDGFDKLSVPPDARVLVPEGVTVDLTLVRQTFMCAPQLCISVKVQRVLSGVLSTEAVQDAGRPDRDRATLILSLTALTLS